MIMKHTKLFELLYKFINNFINEDCDFMELILFFNFLHEFLVENYHFNYVQLGIISPLTKKYSYKKNDKKSKSSNSTTKRIKDIFNRLSFDLDFLLSEYKESADLTIKNYVSMLLKTIDSFFLIKGIFLEEDLMQIFDISSFLKNVFCKIVLNDIKNLTLIYLNTK